MPRARPKRPSYEDTDSDEDSWNDNKDTERWRSFRKRSPRGDMARKIQTPQSKQSTTPRSTYTPSPKAKPSGSAFQSQPQAQVTVVIAASPHTQ